MLIQRTHSLKKELAQYVLLALPTVLLMAYVLKLANQYFAFLENGWMRQTLDFGVGMAAAIFVFARRFRFLPITGLLVLGATLTYKIMGAVYTGEFDAFFWSIKFLNHAILLFMGWLVGYGLSRARFFSIGWSVLLLATMLLVVSHITEVKTDTIILAFAPLLAYSFYIIYTSELIRNMNADEPAFTWFVLKRLLGFGVVLALLFFALLTVFKKDFDAVEKEWGGGGKPKEGGEPKNSLTKNDGQGTTTQTSMGLDGLNNKANKDSVLFVAKLDNYFTDGKTPNPLYFTSDYFTRFDVETQTFEIDTLRPSNDLFSPDVSQIPLFFTREDTSMLRKGMGNRNRKVVTAEVYKHNLSPKLYTAPSTGFFVQPISVPEENKYIYKTAYRAKMYVSELNSAYFVYNPAGNKDLEKFQQQRFSLLRTVTNYKETPKPFYDYYTFIPQGNAFDSMRVLAKSIAAKANATTPVDQIVAIRDYFLEKDENGQPTFKYSDNPGIPGLPSANKLTYFLFENKKGYCAYFAGGTLFLLRALGIPSRVATGFLTVDRSSKNPGWYWFYEDQAHAWVQAYFPGFGWIDFDTTVPNADQNQAPQPDQTPPLTSQTAWLVANGKAVAVDTVAKKVTMEVEKFLYWDNPYNANPPQNMLLEVSLAKISRDSGAVSLSSLQPGEEIVSVSYSEQFKAIRPTLTDSAGSLMKRFPNPAPIDEIKIMAKEEATPPPTKAKAATKPIDWRMVLLTLLGLVGGVFLLLLMMPWLVFQYLHYKAKNTAPMSKKAYWQFMASTYYLHQMGISRGQQSSTQFAQQVVDPRFGTSLTGFMHTFLKLKYSQQPLTSSDERTITAHYPAFWQTVRKQLPPKHRFSHFLNFYSTLHFFSFPKI
ncbi:MAG: hypothetical protein EAY75_06955 [Bacteroidetes bacterium]|nr:MAG: hypothetical protein EAY75_06955 [Bacteroidota bacterium]